MSPGAGDASSKSLFATITEQLARKPLAYESGLLALTVLFGLQVLRVSLSGLTWTIGDRLNLSAVHLGAIALLIFSAAFLAGVIRRRLGEQRAIFITAGGVGLLRLAMQLWWGAPVVSVVLAMAATVMFVLCLPLLLERARHNSATIGYFAIGLLSGLILDTALHGASGTYDIAWRQSLPLIIITLTLVLGQWLFLACGATAERQSGSKIAGGSRLRSWAWLAVGPFLFLQLVVFQNIARLAALTGWTLPAAFGWTLFTQLLALAAAVWLLRRKSGKLWPVSLAGGLALVAATTFPHPQQAWLESVSLLAGQVALSLLMVVVLIGLSARPRTPGYSITAGGGLGMVLLMIFLLGYYASYQLSLPFSNTILPPVAALTVAVCGVLASTRLSQGIGLRRRAWLAPALAALLMVLPLIGLGVWQQPVATSGSGFPIRIMTYNLHNGFNTDGRLDMEALAQVIEENQPDIIALQEISRGWLVSGRLDMLAWLSQRLDMPYAWGPTADHYWGNAILSRYPIIEYANYELPPRDLPLQRGFTSALIAIGNGEVLEVVATHFHHVEADSAIRQLQSGVIAGSYSGAGNIVFLGDLNARPDTPEMELLREAGLVDSMAGSSTFTFHSADLYERIDYIWVSPDLKVGNAYVPFSNASDHLAVVVNIDR